MDQGDGAADLNGDPDADLNGAWNGDGAAPAGRPPIERLSGREIYESRWMRLREDRVRFASGAEGAYSVVTKPDFAVVAPLEETPSGPHLHLVRQHRYPLGADIWEFPQGAAPDGLAGGDQPDPEAIAHAELREEAGLLAAKMTPLGRLHPDTGLIDQTGVIFIATGLTRTATAREATEADMIARAFPVAEVLDRARAGALTDGPTLAALALLLLHGHV